MSAYALLRPAGHFVRGRWVLALAVCCSLVGHSAADEVVVGMSAAFKGPSRGLSIELYRGSMAYFKHINEAGGVHGRQVVIKAYDDGYNPVPAIANTIRLVEEDNAFLLFDYMGSPTVTRVLPLLKKFHDNGPPVFLFFPFTGALPHRQPPYNEFVFNLRASYHQETNELVDHFVRIGRKRIAVFYQIDAYGRSGWDGVRKRLASHDKDGKLVIGPADIAGQDRLRIVGEATYRRGTTFTESMRPQVDILRAANPDAVISIATYSAAAAFVRDARDAGWDVPIANVSGVDSENLLTLLMDTGRAMGKDYTQNLINSQVVPSYHDTSLGAVQQYRGLMDKYQPQPPLDLLDEKYTAPQYSFISFEGFLNAKLLVEILRQIGPELQQSQIKKVVESLNEVELEIDVPVSFGSDRHQGLNKIYCTVVSDGRFVPLADEDWQRWQR